MTSPRDTALYKICHLLDDKTKTRKQLRVEVKGILQEYALEVKREQKQHIEQLEKRSEAFEIVKRLLR